MNSLTSNQVTLQSYELGINEYITATAAETSGTIKTWIDHFLLLVPPHARIMEVGSAHGRDAQYIESCGFSIERTDAATGFVRLLRDKGHTARKFNVLTDNFTSDYDLIFANAVFLHFTPDELEKVLKKIHQNLSENGILAFSVKFGEGEEWTTAKVGNPRYFCYWKKETIQPLLESVGFEVNRMTENEKFLQITAKRKSLH